MTDANDEALLKAQVAALAPVPGIEVPSAAHGRRHGEARSDYDIGLFYRALGASPRSSPISARALLRRVSTGWDSLIVEARALTSR